MTILILTFLLVLVILCAAVARNMTRDEADGNSGWWMVLLLFCFLAATVLFALGAWGPSGPVSGDVDIGKEEVAFVMAGLLIGLFRWLWADK